MQQHNLNSKIDNYCNELEVLSSKMADFFHIGNYNEIYNIDLQRKEILKEISKDVTKLSNNNREKINNLHKKGHYIIIFTARFMGRTNNDYKKANEIGYDFTLSQLNQWGVKFDKLLLGKPSFDLMIDDKAYNYSKNWITEIN